MIKEIFTKRIAEMPTSIFSTISQLANEYKAVNLGQGFPDFDGPEWIKESAYEAMKNGKNQYAPSIGIYSLRKQIQRIYKDYYNYQIDENNDITVAAGATEALFSTILALTEPGDEVVMFEPYYDAHQANVLVAGATPKYVTLHTPDFSFYVEELESEINENTKMIIVNNPHNPTGKVYTYDELLAISELAIKHNLLVLSDEVYEFLTFDNAKHIPIATLPNMKDRTITISSTGKTFSMTGWKIGYTVAQAKLTEAIRRIHQWTTFAVNTPGQHAMAYAFSRLDAYLPEFRALYQAKRDLMLNALNDSNFIAHKPLGSYFMMADIPKERGLDDIETAQELIKVCKVATIPPSVFYSKSDEGKTMLRLCFAKQDETILSGINNLKKF
jgi:aspartate/methionine/tyrosine aminotransferase